MKEFNEMKDMVEMYVLEINKMLERLEELLLDAEEIGYNDTVVAEIFRIMHSTKGVAASMEHNSIAELAHAMEDIFEEIRENGAESIDSTWLTSMLLICKDFLSEEIEKVKAGREPDGDSDQLIAEIRRNLASMKESQTISDSFSEHLLGNSANVNSPDESNLEKQMRAYYAKIFFRKDTEMVSVRALILVQKIKESMIIREQIPYELSNERSDEVIMKKGFQIIFDSEMDLESVKKIIEDNVQCLERFDLNVVESSESIKNKRNNSEAEEKTEKNLDALKVDGKQNKEYINVGVRKLDKLMDITSEIIIMQALLIQNPDLKGLKLKNYEKVARQFKKITNELQDNVMSLRMVPIIQVFQKMKRIVRDVSEKLGKKVDFNMIGENTEVDKNVIDMLSDPLMHMIRNSIDHGLESREERIAAGKPEEGNIVLEARHVGSEVWIEVSDDGRGLNKEKIYQKAFESGLTDKSIDVLKEEEIFSYIFKPGFSTNEVTTEYSGRGVGMDVVYKNIEKLHGTVKIDKTSKYGTTIILKIPLTLAIINGMTVKVGESKYTVSVESIVEIISLKPENIITDTSGKEIINIRGKFYSMVKLYERFGIKGAKNSLIDGMAVIVQTSEEDICIFADSLIGEQQVVVKPMPAYLKKIDGIAGCSLLGDGTITLILDTDKLIK